MSAKKATFVCPECKRAYMRNCHIAPAVFREEFGIYIWCRCERCEFKCVVEWMEGKGLRGWNEPDVIFEWKDLIEVLKEVGDG